MGKILDWFKKVRLWFLLVLLLFGVGLLWYYMPFNWLSHVFPEIKPTQQFGDRFEAVNALFAGLAFAGVIFAIILQWQELGLQRQELKDTRAEIKGQKETLQKQNFESSFFQLLGMHSEIVNSMVIRKGIDGEYFGRECFDYMLQHLRKIYMGAHEQFHAGMHSGDTREVMYEWANDKYERFFVEYQPYVGHYFRHLYNTVKFIHDQKDFPKEFQEKKRYTNLIRAQLSSDELGLLFYNCLSKRGDKFRGLVEKYALLEDMPSKVLIKEEHRSLYIPSAYGEIVYNWDSSPSD